MNKYTYTMGNFSSGLNLSTWEEDETLEAWLSKNNFNHHPDVSIDLQIDIYNHEEKQEYLIFWSHDHCCDGVYQVIGHPSLMMFYRDFITPILLHGLYDELAGHSVPDTLMQVIKKFISKQEWR